MKDIKENNLELTITELHPEDGFYAEKEKIYGKKFNAFLTTTSVGHPGWYIVAGTFKEKTGVDEIDDATKEFPIVFAMAKYTL